ncbi:MAG: 4-(cytidine 5'-diphospho)-2-C-methyl-D-erythritol kinase [Clostridiales bacterium]|nr:4-(cytidine 5'-diphospho)-2-C-methyl-D-erythritol kinase [Clostridiales bacterium]
MVEVQRKAHAKVNLFLRMAGRREDGYHLLYSCMQTLDLHDMIFIKLVPAEKGETGGLSFISNCDYLPLDPKQNTTVDAAARFIRKIGETGYHVRICLLKEIPSQAGLGGGSSDAAAVLDAMDSLFPGRVSREELLEMALAIGADVPFFLTGGTALCEGVGEKVSLLPELSGIPMLLLKPPQGVSTPACYKKWDEMGCPPISDEEKELILQDLKNPKDPVLRLADACRRWSNDLEAPAIGLVPEISEGLDVLRKLGAIYTAMTGSGSCIFGFFANERAVPSLSCPEIQALRERKWWVTQTETV